MPRQHYTVQGHVQGVGFRYFVATAGRGLGLHGTVLNRPDGRVEVEVEGSPDALAELRRLAERGPPGSRVDRVEDMPAGTGPLPFPFRTIWR